MSDSRLDSSVEEALRKTPQFTRFRRHLLTLMHHTTARKLINLAAVELQRMMGSTRVSGYPYIIIVDTGNICNLQCPLCPTGLREKGVDRKLVRFDEFKKVVDRLYPYAYEIALHNWGEPFLNPDTLKMVRYSVSRNIGTNLSSNLNIPMKEVDIEELIGSGLEYLVVSLDGTTPEVYEKYRTGGNLDRVLKNLRNIIQKKTSMKSSTPFIEWQFLVMKHNAHQIDDAKRIAEEIGVDLIRFIPPGLPFDTKDKKGLAEQWYPYMPADNEEYLDERFLQKPIRGGCFYLYRSVTINPGGEVAPCCAVWKDEDNFGNMLTKDFSEIWNNKLYQNARALFSKGQKASEKTVCNKCRLFYRN